jgi:transposase
MRGRKPEEFILFAEHLSVLQQLVRDGRTEQRVARRARILLMRACGERVQAVADKVEDAPSTVWRMCQRYRERGLEAVYDAPRSGRPRVFSPPGTRPN